MAKKNNLNAASSAMNKILKSTNSAYKGGSGLPGKTDSTLKKVKTQQTKQAAAATGAPYKNVTPAKTSTSSGGKTSSSSSPNYGGYSSTAAANYSGKSLGNQKVNNWGSGKQGSGSKNSGSKNSGSNSSGKQGIPKKSSGGGVFSSVLDSVKSALTNKSSNYATSGKGGMKAGNTAALPNPIGKHGVMSGNSPYSKTSVNGGTGSRLTSEYTSNGANMATDRAAGRMQNAGKSADTLRAASSAIDDALGQGYASYQKEHPASAMLTTTLRSTKGMSTSAREATMQKLVTSSEYQQAQKADTADLVNRAGMALGMGGSGEVVNAVDDVMKVWRGSKYGVTINNAIGDMLRSNAKVKVQAAKDLAKSMADAGATRDEVSSLLDDLVSAGKTAKANKGAALKATFDSPVKTSKIAEKGASEAVSAAGDKSVSSVTRAVQDMNKARSSTGGKIPKTVKSTNAFPKAPTTSSSYLNNLRSFGANAADDIAQAGRTVSRGPVGATVKGAEEATQAGRTATRGPASAAGEGYSTYKKGVRSTEEAAQEFDNIMGNTGSKVTGATLNDTAKAGTIGAKIKKGLGVGGTVAGLGTLGFAALSSNNADDTADTETTDATSTQQQVDDITAIQEQLFGTNDPLSNADNPASTGQADLSSSLGGVAPASSSYSGGGYSGGSGSYGTYNSSYYGGMLGGSSAGGYSYGNIGGGGNAVETVYYALDENGNPTSEHIGYIINGVTYQDPNGQTPVPDNSLVKTVTADGTETYYLKNDSYLNDQGTYNPYETIAPGGGGTTSGGNQNLQPETEEATAELDDYVDSVMESMQSYLDSQYEDIDKNTEARIAALKEEYAARGLYNSDALVTEIDRLKEEGEDAKDDLYGQTLAQVYQTASNAYYQQQQLGLQQDTLAFNKTTAEAEQAQAKADAYQAAQQWAAEMGLKYEQLDLATQKMVLDEAYRQETLKYKYYSANHRSSGSTSGSKGVSATQLNKVMTSLAENASGQYNGKNAKQISNYIVNAGASMGLNGSQVNQVLNYFKSYVQMQ